MRPKVRRGDAPRTPAACCRQAAHNLRVPPAQTHQSRLSVQGVALRMTSQVGQRPWQRRACQLGFYGLWPVLLVWALYAHPGSSGGGPSGAQRQLSGALSHNGPPTWCPMLPAQCVFPGCFHTVSA